MTLEQPDDDELFCWKVQGISGEYTGYMAEEEAKAVAKRIGGTCFAFPLYVKPQPPREWVGLTEEEAARCWTTSTVKTWKNIETALKEKNT